MATSGRCCARCSAPPEFWSRAAYRAKLKTPLEFEVSSLRATNADVENAAALAASLDRLGMPLYGVQQPNGYSLRAEPWLGGEALLARMNFALALASNRVPGVSVNFAQDVNQGAEQNESRLEAESARRAGDGANTRGSAEANGVAAGNGSDGGGVHEGPGGQARRFVCAATTAWRAAKPIGSGRRIVAGVAGLSAAVGRSKDEQVATMRSRRAFLKNGALALVGTASIPSFLTRAVMAQATPASTGRKKLVVIFQRGAADGLNIVVPYGEPRTSRCGRRSRFPRQISTWTGFRVASGDGAAKPLWDQKHLAIVHAAGSPDMSRSHFDAQDYMESGTPGVKATEDGWLNRALQAEDERRREKETPFRAVALTAEMPRTLEGKVPALALNRLRDFHVGGGSPANGSLQNSFESLYDQSSRCGAAWRGRRCLKRRRC